MINFKIYKKDLNKNKLDKIIVKIWDNNKTYYIITTLQAIDDYKKTGFLAYDKWASNKKILEYYL